MFGISLSEFAVIAFVFVVLVRPADMPKVARALARAWLWLSGVFTRVGAGFSEVVEDVRDEVKPAESLDFTRQIKKQKRGQKRQNFYDEIEDKKTPKLDI